MVLIRDFTDFRKFLKASIREKSANAASWSSSRFAKECGFRSPSAFRMMLAGKRNISWPQICRIIEALKLDRVDAEAFEAMVWLNQSNDPKVRAFFQRRLRSRLAETDQQRIRQIPSSPSSADWRLGAFTLFCNGRIHGEIEERCKELGLTAAQSNEWLNDLLQRGFLSLDGDTYRIPEKHVVGHTQKDLRNFQRQFLLNSVAVSEKLSSVLYDRGMKIYAHTLESSGPEILHSEILESLNRWTYVAHPADDGSERKLFQINIQLFPVSEAIATLHGGPRSIC